MEIEDVKPSGINEFERGIIERAGKARAELAEKLQVPAVWPEIVNAVSSLCNELERQRSDADRLRAALEAIVNIAGNLSDERVESVNGVNDARSRALMVICARQIAQNALAKGESQQ